MENENNVNIREGVAMKVGYRQFRNAKKYTDIRQALLDRKSVEAVSESFSFLQATLDAIIDGILVVDCKQNICHYNCKFIEMWNIQRKILATKDRSNILTLIIKKLKDPKAYIEKENKLNESPQMESYDILELKDGRIFECYSKPQWLNSKVIGRVLSFRDITKHKQKENVVQQSEEKFRKEMAHLERLNLVGEMAAGIGHEVRNPMTTIRGFLQILISKKECIKYWEYFKLMIEELDRANAIITEFLSLAKEGVVCRHSKNINVIIKSLVPLIEADAIIANKYIKLELSEVTDFLLDEKEIRQLILNLIRNGLDAMSHGGYLTIRTYMEDDEIILAIKDQGTGIVPEVLKKIGTPFFTTKEQGTGLGLAICYSIAARHSAIITIETSNEGTTFFIRFNNVDFVMSHLY
ncbi:MAG: rane signaling protein [Firmicutes bacterium]|nr:rane signaling protein [Bacillota bacterium]